ncbi:MAG: hypothetical protein ACTSR0_07600 [Candidatus Asgardarchaeia archaeon]
MKRENTVVDVLREIYKEIQVGWAITGCFALYNYDIYYLLPPYPPVLSLVVESKELERRFEVLLRDVVKSFDIGLALIVRRDISLEDDPPYPLSNLPVTPIMDALLDSLELAWVGKEPVFLSVQAFYHFSRSVRDFEELIRKAVKYGFTGALKLMNLASGLLMELTPYFLWHKVYSLTLKALGKPVKPSRVQRDILEDIHFAITETVLTYGLYEKIISKFTKNLVGRWERTDC